MNKKSKIKTMLAAYARSLGGIYNSEDAVYMMIHQDSIVSKVDRTWRKEMIDSAYYQYLSGDFSKFLKVLNWTGYRF